MQRREQRVRCELAGEEGRVEEDGKMDVDEELESKKKLDQKKKDLQTQMRDLDTFTYKGGGGGLL